MKATPPPKKKVTNMLRVGTDCSGIDSPIMALKVFGVQHKHLFSCEKDRHARAAIQANFSPEIIYEDITSRDLRSVPEVDLYVCGFPCQPFSTLGKKGGLEASPIFFYARDYIAAKRPGIFLLENVMGLLTHNKGSTFERIISDLTSIGGYDIRHDVINSQDHGLPQSRQRLYILGVNSAAVTADTITFPPPTRPPMLLSEYLKSFPDWDKQPDSFRRQPPYRQRSLKEVYATTPHLDEACYSADLGASKNFRGVSLEKCCCLKASRCDYYISGPDFGRNLTPRETLRLQGVPDEMFEQVCSNVQTYKQAGNAMSVNVLVDIFRQIFQSSEKTSQES